MMKAYELVMGSLLVAADSLDEVMHRESTGHFIVGMEVGILLAAFFTWMVIL